MQSPSKEGSIAFAAPGADESCSTYYRIFGPLPSSSTPPPLVCLHGGPGCASEYLLPMTDLSDGRPVILYDQLGCGRSTHLPARRGDVDFWTEALFRAELDNLIDTLGLRAGGFHIVRASTR